MKKITTLVLISLLFLVASQAIAQNLIAVQNGGTPKFYTDLSEAVNNALAKDTIYIPGGVFYPKDNLLTINKELHLIGAGHHPDSTRVTSTTYINSDIKVILGANKSTFEGFCLSGNFSSGTTTANEDVDQITISRCNLGGNMRLSRFSNSWLIYETILRSSVYGYSIGDSYNVNAQNNIFSNNIASGITYFGPGNYFRNNIVFGGFDNIKSSFIENNVFYIYQNSSLCTLNNNLTTSANTNMLTGNYGVNNMYELYDAIYAIPSFNTFSYSYDYRIKSSSSGKNSGTDGTDRGIYGGMYPWKAGSVPSNPHFQFKQISGTTDANGNLNIKIKVAAQEY